MNSLEWINKQILFVKENIQYHKNLLAKSEEEYADEIISAIKLLEPELQTLQQIKTELEAWEVVKNKIFIEKGSIDYANINIKDWNHNLTKDQYQKLKKALEVKDDEMSFLQ